MLNQVIGRPPLGIMSCRVATEAEAKDAPANTVTYIPTNSILVIETKRSSKRTYVRLRVSATQQQPSEFELVVTDDGVQLREVRGGPAED